MQGLEYFIEPVSTFWLIQRYQTTKKIHLVIPDRSNGHEGEPCLRNKSRYTRPVEYVFLPALNHITYQSQLADMRILCGKALTLSIYGRQ